MVLISRARWLLENALIVTEFGSLAAAKIVVKLNASFGFIARDRKISWTVNAQDFNRKGLQIL